MALNAGIGMGGDFATQTQGIGSRALPDSVKAKLHEKMAEPGSAED